jgi:hypothetical protein
MLLLREDVEAENERRRLTEQWLAARRCGRRRAASRALRT